MERSDQVFLPFTVYLLESHMFWLGVRPTLHYYTPGRLMHHEQFEVQ